MINKPYATIVFEKKSDFNEFANNMGVAIGIVASSLEADYLIPTEIKRRKKLINYLDTGVYTKFHVGQH